MKPVDRKTLLALAALAVACLAAFELGRMYSVRTPRLHVREAWAASSAAPAKAATPVEPALGMEARKRSSSPFEQLAPLRVCNVNTRACQTFRLYDRDGAVDEGVARELDVLLGDRRDEDALATIELDRRLLKLVFRAAYHFAAPSVEVVSGYRKPRRKREGPHGKGDAMDFKLPNVPAATLAAYLRKVPRVGVGVYTHPRTQYVHLDVREQSYHWIDASPPRRNWRERPLRIGRLAELDAAYTPESDWPESVLERPRL